MSLVTIVALIGLAVLFSTIVTECNKRDSNALSSTSSRSNIDLASINRHINSDNLITAKSKSEYEGNQLSNGSSPFDDCFGNGVFRGNATLTIQNGSTSDAIICLYSLDLGRTIRNHYVQKSSSFTIKQIAQGSYRIKVFYGNDWNPTINNPCGGTGYFDSDVSFSEFDGSQFFEDSDDGYTVASVTLYTVAGGNASTSSISSSDFFGS